MESFEQQAKEAAASVINLLTAITPVFLVIAILGIAIFNGWLEYVYYTDIIGSLAFVPGTIFASIRFGSGLGGIHMFRNGEYFRGIFFIVISVGLTLWTSAHAPQMAKSIAIAPAMFLNAEWFIRTALWVSLLGELMIATYMSAASATTATAKSKQGATKSNGATWYSATPQQSGSATSQHVTQSLNGNGATNVSGQAQHQQIGYRRNSETLQSATDANTRNAVANSVSGDSLLVAEDLKRAQSALRTYRSRLQRNDGNPETLRKGVARWEHRVTELEGMLQ